MWQILARTLSMGTIVPFQDRKFPLRPQESKGGKNGWLFKKKIIRKVLNVLFKHYYSIQDQLFEIVKLKKTLMKG